MTRKPQAKGAFGSVYQLPSGRFRAQYYGPEGKAGPRYKAPTTFTTKTEARKFLATVQTDIIRNAMDEERRQLAERLTRSIEDSKCEAAAEIVTAAIDDSFDPTGCFVYILWGDDPDTPVYVGSSGNVLNRTGSHMGDRRKRDQVRRIQFLRCQDAETMVETELRLIRHYRPTLNIAGKDPR